MLKQLIHASAVRSWRYETVGKFGEEEEARVARGVPNIILLKNRSTKLSLLSALRTIKLFRSEADFLSFLSLLLARPSIFVNTLQTFVFST